LLLLKKDSDAPTSTEKRDYMDFAYRIISKMLNLPTDMQIANLTFKLDDNGKKATIGIKELTLFDNN
jgi:hypothetical protein